MVIASVDGEVGVQPSAERRFPASRSRKLTGDGDRKGKDCELERNHGERVQGVVRLERLVAAGGEGRGARW